jgi:hypothetical protein
MLWMFSTSPLEFLLLISLCLNGYNCFRSSKYCGGLTVNMHHLLQKKIQILSFVMENKNSFISRLESVFSHMTN